MDCLEELEFPGSSGDNVNKIPVNNVLHFSDGTLDLDDLDGSRVTTNEVPVDPQKLSWAPWMWYYTMFAGNKALEVCDYLGEFFATFFGITTPKYQYEISEYHRMQKEELEQSKADRERKTNWPSGGQLNQSGEVRQQKVTMDSIHFDPANTIQTETAGCV